VGAVQRWFCRRRGFASGIAVSGIGVGTVVMPPVASFLIGMLGWRGAYFVLGAIAIVIGAVLALLIENDPRDRGLAPDGDPPLLGSVMEAPGVPVRAAITSRRFIALYAASLICSFGAFIPFVHLVPFALDHGIAPSPAALLLALIGVGSTVGRFVLGSLTDRMGGRWSLLAMFLGMALSLVIWAISKSFWTLSAFALIYGIFYGGWVAVRPVVVMDYFGGRNVSGMIGMLYTSIAFGTLLGPTVAGFAFDASHSYTLPILLSAVANVIAAAIMADLPKATTSMPASG
jgi:predicted MFS family arabinose efflux permease